MDKYMLPSFVENRMQQIFAKASPVSDSEMACELDDEITIDKDNPACRAYVTALLLEAGLTLPREIRSPYNE